MDSSFLYNAFIYLCAGTVAVPIAKRLGMGSVLGYLLAGVLVGPFGLGLIGDNYTAVMHFAEFGVVMMLFLIGLELEPSRLWQMRVPILGTGGGQVLLTMLLFFGLAKALGVATNAAIAISMILSLSSTAIVLQTLAEKSWLKRPAGQASFAVLLFQDIAVIPMLAILPLLGLAHVEADGAAHSANMISHLHGGFQTLIVIAVIAAIIFVGRFLARPLFRFIAETDLREIFTAAALLLVVGISLVMQLVGLSPALGAFVAGVVLATSEFRHELESDIEPFKGLLLGLFFISVGAGIDFALAGSKPFIIAGLVIALIFAKFVVLYLLSVLSKQAMCERLLFSMGLAQAGEFAFVLFSFAEGYQVIPADLTKLLTVVVALTMLLTPLLMILYDRVIAPRLQSSDNSLLNEPQADHIVNDDPDVVLAGFGRFGTVVGRLLMAEGFKVTVLDHNMRQIENLRKFGFKIYYGDATRADLLVAAGIEKAKLLIIGVDAKDKINELVAVARQHFPEIPLITRAKDRNHLYELLGKGVPLKNIFRDLFGTSLDSSSRALELLGYRAYRAFQSVELFRYHDLQILEDLAAHQDDEAAYVAKAKSQLQKIEDILKQDAGSNHTPSSGAWEAHRPAIADSKAARSSPRS